MTDKTKKPFSCGNCGASFDTKGDKRRHKKECAPKAIERLPEDTTDEDEFHVGQCRNNPTWVKEEAARLWADIPDDALSIASWKRGKPINPKREVDAHRGAM